MWIRSNTLCSDHIMEKTWSLQVCHTCLVLEARIRPIKSSEEALSLGYTGLISAQQVPYYEMEKNQCKEHVLSDCDE